MSSEQSNEEFKYWAFISYSHADSKWADWLHKGLETYSVPKHLVGKPTREGIVPKRPYPVFRDRDELPGSANLGDNLTRALRQSRYLVVICSPKAAASQWVDQEIRIFKSLGREDRVLCLIVDGEPNAAAHPELGLPECFPEAVRFWVDSDRRITEIPTEPIAADCRKGKDGRQNALLKILAGILGVGFDNLKQRDAERRQRQLNIVMTGLGGLVFTFAVLGYQLYTQKNAALDAKAHAEKAQAEATKQELIARTEKELADKARKEADEAKNKAVAALDGEKKARDEALQSERDARAAEKIAVEARNQAQASEKKATDALEETRRARDAARASEAEAVKARDLAEERRKEISRALAASDFSEATRLIGENNEAKAIASLARALRYDTSNTAVTTRLLSLLSQHNWSMPKMEPLKFTAEVKFASFSADGKRLLTTAGNLARVWEIATRKELAQLRHQSMINAAQFSPDGRFVVTASQDNFARVWNADTGRSVAEMKHGDWVVTARFSPDSKWVVSGGQDKSARVWEAATGKPVVQLDHTGPVLVANFSADGKFLITGSGTAGRIWELPSGKTVGTPLEHTGGMAWAVFSPDGKLVATSSGDYTARVWEASSGKPVTEPLKHEGWVYSAQFSGDGRLLVTASADKSARIWEVASGKPMGTVMRHDNAVNYAEFSPNARWILTLSEDATGRIWDAASGQPVTEALKHGAAIRTGGFSADGQYVVTGSVDQTARVWEISTARPLVDVYRHDQWVNAVAFSADNRLLATASDDRTARVWDTTTGRALSELPLAHPSRVTLASFSPDGARLLTAAEDRIARVWDVNAGKPAFSDPLRHESMITAALYSPDGKYILTASEDRTARLWDATTGKQVHKEMKHDGGIKSARFSTDGQLIVTASADRTARLWSVATGQQVGPSMAHKGEVLFAHLSVDGKMVVTCSEDKTARVWEVPSGLPLTEPLIHDATVTQARFNPTNRWILTVSDKLVRIWNISTGTLVTEPVKSDEAVKFATFSPDGQLLLTTAEKTARLWDAATGTPVAEPFRHDGPIRAATFSADGSLLATAAADNTARLWLVTLPGAVPAWLVELAEATGGYRQGDSGAAQLIPDPWRVYASAKQRLASAGRDSFGIWGQWYAADRISRPISPFSKVTTAEYIRHRVDEGTPAALNEALNLQPNNGLALAKIARGVKDLDQAEFYSALAEKYEPNNADVLWHRALVLQQQSKFADALGVLNRALAADPRNISTFGPAGTELVSINKEGFVSKGWLPAGWSDFNATVPVAVTYEKLSDGPANLTAIRISATGSGRPLAQVRGPRFVGRQGARFVVEGWVRSSIKTDLNISIRQIVEPFPKYHEVAQKSTPEWTRFQFKFIPAQDYGAEVFLSVFGGPVDVAGVVVRPE